VDHHDAARVRDGAAVARCVERQNDVGATGLPCKRVPGAHFQFSVRVSIRSQFEEDCVWRRTDDCVGANGGCELQFHELPRVVLRGGRT
jgi:hypothetical protein